MPSALRVVFWFALPLLPLFHPASAPAEEIYLRAGFDDKTIDAPIGTGGAAVGEPIVVSGVIIDATVRATPMPTPCLEILDKDDYSGGAARFGLLGDAEITSGPLVIAMDIWIPDRPESGGLSVAIREQGSAAHTFLDVWFGASGMGAGDNGGAFGVVSEYSVGEVLRLLMLFDMDEGTYDLLLDGVLLLDDEPHDESGAGIGTVLVGVLNDPSVGGRFYVDNIYVGDEVPTPVEADSWGVVKSRFLPRR